MNVKKVQIGPIEFEIRELEGLKWDSPEGVQMLNGSIEHSKLIINLEEQLPDVVKVITLWHECIHGMMDQAGIQDHDEGLVAMLGFALFDFVRKNREFIQETWQV